MIVLDTNVLSELMKPDPSRRVADWVNAIRRELLFTTAVNQAEILVGLAMMPLGRKRDGRIAAADAMFAEDFRGRILSFDTRAAAFYAEFMALRRSLGRPAGTMDAQVVGIAAASGMSIATRDTSGFESSGLDIVDPWATA